ncbi:MAG: glycogen/starch/alpha-glucan phosphorylase [Zetaproteobacteria bacterium]|nr:MAG: glycogen/starch/alpha-glucan phosphorylase [Zetaproteobacteria bacterium]
MSDPEQRETHPVDDRVEATSAAWQRDYQRVLRLVLARREGQASEYDAYSALALLCRERLIDRWLDTQQRREAENPKYVYYLSLEFLMGRHLQNAVLNMDVEDTVRAAMQQLGLVLEDLYEQEFDPGLGNGGLGRLAACFLDSMATLDIPAYGYGIRYEFGIFRQVLRDGQQVELPDNWLYRGNPWEVCRPEEQVRVGFYGHCVSWRDGLGREHRRWIPGDEVLAVPYDTPVPGYGTNTVNTLRLWEARASKDFDLEYFNRGDYLGAVARKVEGETISKVLYPADDVAQGQELRLKQQYFFVAASLRDLLNRFLRANQEFDRLPDKAAVQLNDTHPSIAVAELMRLLVDEYALDWERAWRITQGVFAYTNHTLLPEALECWGVDLLGRLLPRHLEIIYEINHRFLEQVAARYPGDVDLLRRVSLIDEEHGKRVRMAHLAVVGSHSVNGVARLHSDLLKRRVLPDFHRLFPERFNNKTNGVTPRRWLKQANPALSLLLDEHLGHRWPRELDRLSELRRLADDAGFQEDWRAAKAANKNVLAELVLARQGVALDPAAMFDVQVKRIHEYKRQLLNLLRVIADYLRIREGVDTGVPRVVMLGGKAAPSYFMAKLIIRLACAVAERVNRDPACRGRLQVVFLENYNVSLAERIFPASDLSEQISTAGFEASGTGNMKFAMNGALTIGTLDGANIEIMEAVGREHMFIFGLTAEQVFKMRKEGYDPARYPREDTLLHEVLQTLCGDFFSPAEPGLFRPLYDALVHGGDTYMLLADFRSYVACQQRVDDYYRDRARWTRSAILNVASMGRFSSDRTIREYAREIWGLELD